MNETASDSMIDIQIEESLVRETLMTIDSANLREDVITLFGFACIVLLSIVTGVYGPISVNTQEFTLPVTHHGMVAQKNFVTGPMTGLNRFLCLEVNGKPSKSVISWEVLIEQDGMKTGFECGTVNLSSHGKDGQLSVPFFGRYVTEPSTFRVRLRATGSNLAYLNGALTAYTGDPSHTILQFCFRSVFALFALLFMLMLAARLRSMPFKLWHVEQKVTIPLLLISALYCNPFYVFVMYHPSEFWDQWNVMMTAVFASYVRFFIIVLFGSFNYANKRIGRRFFVPKLVYAAIVFVVCLWRGRTEFPNRSPNVNVAEYLDRALSAFYYAWLLFEAVRSYTVTDITERYKYNMYVVASIVLIATSLFTRTFLATNYRTSLTFTLLFSVENVFALFMAYCHWPYEVMHDQSYVDSTH